MNDASDAPARATGMWAWLQPPVYESAALTERARLMHWVLRWGLGLLLTLSPLVSLLSGWSWGLFAAQVASVLTVVVGLVVVQRSVETAGVMVSVLALTVQTANMWTHGIQASSLGGFCVVVTAVGFFLDGKRAALAAFLSCVAMLAMAGAQAQGWVGVRPLRPLVVVAVESSLQVLIILTLLGAGLRSLRASEARAVLEARRHARLIARSPDGIFELDADGVIGAFNPAAERLTGRFENSVIGQRLWDLGLASPEDSDRAREHINRVWKNGGDSPFEIDINKVDEEAPVPVEIYPRRVMQADGRVGLMATCRDLRARRRVEAERSKLQELLQHSRHLESVGRLAGGVAHDFNNLLTVMLSNTQLLLDTREPGPHWREDVEQISAAATKASELTQQLLAFARRETMETELTDINEPLRGLQPLLANLCGKSVEVEYILGEGLPKARLDRTRFEQIVLNLAANARDAMPQGGHLQIKSAAFVVDPDQDPDTTTRGMPPGPYVWLRVQDDGEGMDAHTAAHVFEPFFTTKRARGGTGLGLATVHGVVAQSAGFVFVETSPGGGTAFDVFFPEAEGEADTTSKRWRRSRVQGAARATLLLLEDEPVSGRLTVRVLKEHGYEVLWARSLAEAREHWAEHQEQIGLLLSEVVLPDGMGAQFARELHAERGDLPVVYLSGFEDDTLGGNTREAPAEGPRLLRGPLSVNRLVDAVRRALA